MIFSWKGGSKYGSVLTGDPTADTPRKEGWLKTRTLVTDDPGTGPSLTGPKNSDGTLDAPRDEAETSDAAATTAGAY